MKHNVQEKLDQMKELLQHKRIDMMSPNRHAWRLVVEGIIIDANNEIFAIHDILSKIVSKVSSCLRQNQSCGTNETGKKRNESRDRAPESENLSRGSQTPCDQLRRE